MKKVDKVNLIKGVENSETFKHWLNIQAKLCDKKNKTKEFSTNGNQTKTMKSRVKPNKRK